MVAGSSGAEVSASGSHAVLAAELVDLKTEYAELRRALWSLIGSAKQAAPFLSGVSRQALLDATMAAAAALSAPGKWGAR